MAAPEYGARNYAGAAVPTTLSSDITGASPSMTVADGSSYPATRFFITIDPGLATEEKIYVATRSGNLFSGLERAEDDTGAQGHTAGAVVRHGWIAQDAREANAMSSVLTGRGGLITRSTATGPQELVAGTDGLPLVPDQTTALGLKYAPLALTVGLAPFVNGKGALLAGGTAGAPTEVAAGPVDFALIANPAQPAGVAFADIGLGAWSTSWAPVITQGATMTYTSLYSHWVKRGRHVEAVGAFHMTNTGTTNALVEVSLPVPAVDAEAIRGSFVHVTAAQVITGLAFPALAPADATKARFIVNQATSTTPLGGSGTAFTLGLNHDFRVWLSYEAAS